MDMTALKGKTADELLAIIAQMNAVPARRLTMKVTNKGGLSLYGLGRFPVTLYRSQWEKLLGAKDELEAFMAANASMLTTKD